VRATLLKIKLTNCYEVWLRRREKWSLAITLRISGAEGAGKEMSLL